LGGLGGRAIELILWRHAQAEDGAPDVERALTPRGRRDAARVADWLSAHIPAGGATVLCSPTRRTRETAAALRAHRGAIGRFEVTDAIGPQAAAADVLRRADWSDRPGGLVILVGHQPWIGEAAALAVAGAASPWPVRKGGLWWLARGEGGVRVRAVISPELLRTGAGRRSGRGGGAGPDG
jgi:phosphohistidine phosphatase